MDMFNHPTPCDPKRCKFDQCHHAPAEHCQLEKEFMEIAKKWTATLPESPVTRLRVDYMLLPLFQQYFRVRLTQEASGKTIKDIKDVIRALNLVLNSIRFNKTKGELL